MKVLGNAPDGDLIIQVSQTEWDSLQDGIRPVNNDRLAFAVLGEERKKCNQLRLEGRGNPKLTNAINATYRWLGSYRDMTFCEFLERLEAHYFIAEIPGFGLKLQNLLIEHFSKDKPNA
jgi:hypothetical protein